MTVLTLPCPTCNEDGFVSFEDRHTETNTSVCPTCRGRKRILAATGEGPQSSASPVPGAGTYASDYGAQYRDSLIKAGDRTVSRDACQAAVEDWVVRCFGPSAQASVAERVERLFEEVVELCQAENMPVRRMIEIINCVLDKSPGEPPQEVGGIGTTLLAYCASRGYSADDCERRELARILSKPPEHFRERQAAKVASGQALPFGEK